MKKTKTPKVSVVTITYNQEKYIEQALKSFLKQRTNFPFEVIVCDDASTDNTPSIIRRYAKEYPNIFHAILREKNLGSTGNFYDALSRTKGEYIALCEGDDYWTDPNKLSLQVKFMDKHKDHGLCFHRGKVFFEDKSQSDYTFPDSNLKAKDFTIERLMKTNFIQTNSVLFRRQNYNNIEHDAAPVDWYMHLYHAKHGKIGFINKIMSNYRRHEGGIWWNVSKDETKMWKENGLSHLILFNEMMKMFPENKEIATNHIFHAFDLSVRIDPKLLYSFMEKFPKLGSMYIRKVVNEKDRHINNISDFLSKKDEEINNLQSLVLEKDKKIHNLSAAESELKVIKETRVWKLINLVKRIKNG